MKRVLVALGIVLGILILWGCAAAGPQDAAKPPDTGDVTPSSSGSESPSADVISVEVTGASGSYRFSVGISSPDKGCEQYADWWEVLTENGELVYRRILAHSHADEQPFVRAGGPVPIGPDTVVWVRAHMRPGGYGGTAFRGSIQAGFREIEPDEGFADGVEDLSPLPEGCAF